jgi:signal transduction histidine kinase
MERCRFHALLAAAPHHSIDSGRILVVTVTPSGAEPRLHPVIRVRSLRRLKHGAAVALAMVAGCRSASSPPAPPEQESPATAEAWVILADAGDPNRPAYRILRDSFHATLKRTPGVRAIIFDQAFDTRFRNVDQAADTLWAALYAGKPITAIAATGMAAAQRSLTLVPALKAPPVIAYLVDDGDRDLVRDAAPDFGVPPTSLFPMEQERNLALVVAEIVRLLPRLTHLVTVSQSIEETEDVAQALAARPGHPVTLVPWVRPTPQALRDSLRRLSPTSAVLFISLHLDGRGDPWVPADFLATFAPWANRPVFGLYRNLLGQGIVGGPLIDPGAQGIALAQQTLRAMGHGDGSDPQVVVPLYNAYDWAVLRRHRIATGRVPQGAHVINRPSTLWETHPVATSFGVTALLMLATALGLSSHWTRLARQSNERLRGLAQRLIVAQDGERARISRDLHDTVGQDLLLQAVELERYSPALAAPGHPPFAARLRDSIRQLETISRELNPVSLRYEALETSLGQLANSMSERSGVAIALTCDGPLPPLEPQRATTAYRIVHEALMNVVRHAQATNASIHLSVTDHMLEITVSDNGVGFAPSQLRTTRLGVLGMRQRAESVQGSLQITSGRESGTTVFVRIPVHPPEA